MAFDPLSAIAGLIDKGLDKFIMDKGEKERLQKEMTVFLAQEATKEKGIFRDFILKYEGAAEDVPKIIILLRSLIRPVFTILVGYLDFLFFTGSTTTWAPEAIALLKAINIIVLAFWFGERAVKNSGIVSLLAKNKK